MNSTTIPRHVVAVHGNVLGGELRKLLRDLGYNLQAVKDVVDHIGVHGTCEGSAVEPEDVEPVEGLVISHTANVEYESAEDWPAWTDRGQWIATDAVDFPAHTEPANAPLPSEAYLPPDLEPSYQDRNAWAEIQDREERIDRELDRLADEARAVELMTRGLDAFPAPVCGGSPSPDERPVKLRPWDDQTGVRSRPQPNVSDLDHLNAHGCV